MYHQHGDTRFPAEYGSGHSHAGIDSSAAAGRYMYGPYYGPKGPDGSPFGTMNPPGSGLQAYGGKPPAVALQDPAYSSRWNTPGYMRTAGLKPGADYVYSNQPSSAGGYPDIGPMMNMSGYPPPNYGPYTPQYPYSARGYSGGGPTQGTIGFMDGYTDGGHVSSGHPPSGPPWPNKPLPVGKGQEVPSGQSPQWSYRSADGYSSSTPNTPGQPAPTAADSSQVDPASQSVEQPPTLLSQQQALSPHTHFDSELKKQPSVSSLRDALLSTPNSAPQQQYAPYSPRVPGGHRSPMTPSANFPHTPDASTPAGGSSIMSPHIQQCYDEKNDSQLPTESELINSFAQHGAEEEARPMRVSPFQVESILGIRNDKPIDLEANLGDVNSVDNQERSTVLSPQDVVHDSSQPGHENNVHAVSENNAKPTLHPPPSSSPTKVVHSFPDPHAEDGDVLQDIPSPSMSPVDHNHPCITSQYQFSDEERRKEFLDLLFAFLTLKGIGLVRIPTFSKTPLDLFKVYSSVQNLGGFVNVTQKKLWPEIFKVLSPSSDNCAGSMRTLMRFYVKLILPYECHIRHTTVTECLSKVDSSVFRHLSIAKKVNMQNEEGALDGINAIMHEGKINGEADPNSGHNSRRLNSQTSESSTGETSNQELEGMAVQEPMDKEEQHSDAPEETQKTPVDSYPPDMSSDEPLPEISAQETESLLAMPASPYLPPTQPPVTTGGPSTPSADQATPPSSFPPPYPPQGSQEWGPSAGQEMFSSPGYPSAYPMDTSSYRPPSQTPPMPHGYSPYTPPSQHDVSMDYHLDMPSPMMRSPYDSNPYHMGISPTMHGLPGSRPSPYLYRPQMMPRPDPFSMRNNDVMYPGPPGMNSEWAWQQGSRFPTMMHHHSMQSPSRSSPALQQSSASRIHMLQQVPHPASQYRSSTNQSPGPVVDTAKQQWQEQAKAAQSRVLDKTSTPSRSTKGEGTKTGATKSEHVQMLDSLKRPLPDWSGCVEGTKPHLAKRKHLLSVDCGNVEPWRVMMSLKSGLLSESTWALDTLNILLHDDSTVGYFHLKHHHSLLNTLVDHLSKVLQAIFSNEFDSLPNHPDMAFNDAVDMLCKSVSTNETVQPVNAPDEDGTSSGCEGDVNLAFVDDNSRDVREGHRLSHIEIPTADESLLFTVDDQVRQITPSVTDDAAEGNQRIQKIDETPVSELQHRERLKNQLPLHFFGRSPRRREHSILEDIQIREELEKEIDERLHSETDSEGRQRGSLDQKQREVFTFPGQSSKEKEVNIVKEESEIYQKESLPLWSLAPNREILQGRCLCLSNILRSLSFIPGNDVEFSQHPGILTILGRILMLHHNHLIRHKRHSALPSLENSDAGTSQSNQYEFPVATTSTNQVTLPGIDVWWWDCLEVLRENTLVILSNISGQLDLSIFPESVSCPIITGLLHWVTCPSARAVDPLPDTAVALALSPQRLVLEALAKISISEINVDFILATPPVTRLDTLFMHLVQFIGQKKHPVMRQFALVLLSNLAQGNEAASRLVAQQKMVIPLLVECIESSEQTSCNSRGQLIGGYNPEDPNSLSVAMLRRAATTLHCLAKVPLNRTAFLPYRDRTLYLATSQYVEPSVSSILMDMVFELGKL